MSPDTSVTVLHRALYWTAYVLSALGIAFGLSSARVAYDAIDVAAATAHGVLVFTTPGTVTESVADFTLALMLGCLRDIVGLNAAVRSGQWRARRLGRDLCGTTVAIVGLGAIGQAV